MNKTKQIKDIKRKELIGKLFVIAIGINEYNSKDENLSNCCTDAKSIFDTIKSKDYFSMDDKSILITSDKKENTYKQSILDSIKSCEKFIDEKTNIVLYYSGHGCNIDDTFYFCVTDSELPDYNLISDKEIIDILSRMNGGKYKSITLLIDACQSQLKYIKSLAKQSSNFLNEYINNAKGIGIIYSCSKGEYSLNEFNKQKISVFTYLILQALNGHTDAVDANCLTLNKLYDFLQIQSRKISRENIHINQHPQIFFKGNDIVYCYIPDECLHDKDIAISVYTEDEEFVDAMFRLQNAAECVCMAKDLPVWPREYDVVDEIPSEWFIRQVFEGLAEIGLIDKYMYNNILSQAFTYLSLIDLKSTESLQTSVKKQIINDINSLCEDWYSIYDRYIDKLY